MVKGPDYGKTWMITCRLLQCCGWKILCLQPKFF